MDAHAVLGVAADATEAEVRDAYLRRSKELHPDRFADASADDQATATRAMQELNAAYAQLRHGAAEPPPAPPRPRPRPRPDVAPVFDAPPLRPARPRGRWFWPLVLVAVIVGSTLLALITGSSLNPPPPSPDAGDDLSVLTGECITLDANDELADVVECTRPHDARVVTVVTHGAACPVYVERRMAGPRQDLCLDDQ